LISQRRLMMVLVLLPSSPSTTPIPCRPLKLQTSQHGAAEEDEADQSRNLPRVRVEQGSYATTHHTCDGENKVGLLNHDISPTPETRGAV
jgi:hypothetical protein